MKIKTKKTTVWQTEVSLIKYRIIDNKFNFTSLDNLYVTNLNYFIEKLIKDNKSGIYRINKDLKLGKDYVSSKIRNREAIPIQIVKKILNELTNQYNDKELINLCIKNKSKFYYFKNGGSSKTIKLPYYVNEIISIIKFLKPSNKKNKVYILTKENKIIKIIRDLFSVKVGKRDDGIIEINSITLNRFLKHFFDYKKKPLLDFPLTDINFKNIDLIKGIILPLLLTDGSVYKNKYSVYYDFCNVSKNKRLHDIFADSMHLTLKKYPSQYFALKFNNFRKTSFITDHIKAKEMLKICNSTKKSPSNKQDKKDYLKELQPTIDFLFKCNNATKIMALRIWFCTEGSISLNRGKKSNTIRARLHLACAHPKLLEQLKYLLQEFDIQMNIGKKDTTWSGYEGLYTTKINSILNFLKIGGFLAEVYIQNSKFHRGVEKQKMLLAILEYIKKEKKGIYKRNVAIKKVHDEINNIVRRFEIIY